MTPLAYIILGAVLFAFLGRYLRVAASVMVFLLSLWIAYRVVVTILPQFDNPPAFLASGALWLILFLIGGGAWFYMLGWRGRALATEADEKDRATQKRIKDSKVIRF